MNRFPLVSLTFGNFEFSSSVEDNILVCLSHESLVRSTKGLYFSLNLQPHLL